MKLKTIFPVALCIFIGFLMSNFMIGQYDIQKVDKPLSEKLYFFQIGVYSSEENMKKNLQKVANYIYEKQDNLYYAYVGIVKSEQNLDKVEGYFKKSGNVIYKKEKIVTNQAFLEVVEQYDILLKETNDEKSISSLMSSVISKYEELVLRDQN